MARKIPILFFSLHKAVGLVFILIIARFLWRLSQPVPTLPKSIPPWQKVAAHANIYFLLFCMPLAGLIMTLFGGHDLHYFGLFIVKAITQGPTDLSVMGHAVHVVLAYVLISVVFLHTMPALYHQFYLKNNLLRCMIKDKLLSEN